MFKETEIDEEIIISGVLCYDYNVIAPSNVTIIDGGIRNSFVKIQITADPGARIRLSFNFFYKRQQIRNDHFNLEHFFESNVDIQ